MSRLRRPERNKIYEAGADVGRADDLEGSCIFQGRIIEEYERMVEELAWSLSTPACRSRSNKRG
jgi:hypothetical protein